MEDELSPSLVRFSCWHGLRCLTGMSTSIYVGANAQA
jgi:hypothetical protein